MITRNTLTTVQSVKLYNFLDKDHQVTQGTKAEELARQATIALGFPVNNANVSNLRRDMGLMPQKTERKSKSESAIQTLAREFMTLNKELGRPTQPCIVELAK